jgi:RHS repeat-associated protein
VEKVVTGTNAVTTVSIRSGGQVIAEYDNGATVTAPTREYLYGNNLLAIVTGSTGGSGGTIIYQHRDTLSTRLYTNSSGGYAGDQGPYPFGESWYNNSTTSNWVYTSYERDAESGNDYALARSYANTNGRFLSPDPLEGIVGDPQSWNRYAYVENDPINLSDPSGESFWEDLGFAIADVFLALVPGGQAALPGVLGVEASAEAGNVAVTLDDGTHVVGPWGGSSTGHAGDRVYAYSRNGPWYPYPTCGDCDDVGSPTGSPSDGVGAGDGA